jgi:V/A-type H+/Na+-transporting ATPase subunit K
MLSKLEIILPLVLVVLITLPLVKAFLGKTTKKEAKTRLYTHVSLFFALVLFVFIWQASGLSVFAEEVGEETVQGFAGSIAQGLGFIGAALTTGMSALGAGVAVAAAAPAAIGAFSENDKNFGKSLIFVALGEGVAIYGLLISILIINKL